MLIGFSACLLLLLAITLWGYLKTRQFLNRHRAIDCHDSLDAFRHLARGNMRLSLAAIIAGCGFFLLLLQQMDGTDTRLRLILIFSSLPVFVMVKILKDAEMRARNLPCHNHELKQHYDKAADSWIKKLLPDF